MSSLARAERLVVTVAAFGFFFDAYELLTLPLILGPALLEMGVPRESAEFNLWAGLMFWLPAVCGGLMGLAGGYLADRFGRRRVLVWSILVYAIASSASAFSTTPLMLLICRCLILVGVCVEFVAGVAWLAEMFSDPRRREANLGFSQAIAGLGGLAVTGIYILAVKHGDALPEILGAHAPWRYTCLSGLLPALPLLLVRPFLPESPMWKAGQVRPRPPVAALFQGSMRRTTWAAIAATACTYALAYGAMQHLPRVVVALPEVSGLSATMKQATAGNMQLFQETGGLVGRLLLATLVVAVVARRRLLTIAQVAALIAFPLTFAWFSTASLTVFEIAVFITAAITAAQFSFWGSYLPRVFPTALRSTGESFAANVGGRILGTTAALATTALTTRLTPAYGAGRALALSAATVATIACVIGLIASRFITEPESDALPQ